MRQASKQDMYRMFTFFVQQIRRGEYECKRKNNEVDFHPSSKYAHICTHTHISWINKEFSNKTKRKRQEKEKCDRYIED